MDRLEERPLVSCHIITYNQKDYISKCIEGALMQETSFPYEIVIGDDCSTDGTREILLEYEKKYPEKIKLNLRKKRGKGILGQDNFFSTMHLCSGKYVALCDGDDYWTDSMKLQKQFNFMESTEEFSFCVHRTFELNQGTGEMNTCYNEFFINSEDKLITKDNYLSEYIINSTSVFFRLGLIDFKKINRKGFKDIYLYTLLLNKGNCYSLPYTMGVYRVNSTGIWSTGTKLKMYEGNLETIRELYKNKTLRNNDLTKMYRNVLKSILIEYGGILSKYCKRKYQLEFEKHFGNYTLVNRIQFFLLNLYL